MKREEEQAVIAMEAEVITHNDYQMNNILKELQILIIQYTAEDVITLSQVSKSFNQLVYSSLKGKWFSHATSIFHIRFKVINDESLFLNSLLVMLNNTFIRLYDKHTNTIGETCLNNYKDLVGLLLTRSFLHWRALIQSPTKGSSISLTPCYIMPPFTRPDDELGISVKEVMDPTECFYQMHRRYLKRMINDPLAMKNAHPRDCRVEFYGKNNEHYYVVYIIPKETDAAATSLERFHSKKECSDTTRILLTSVTTWINHSLFDEFKEELVITNMHNSPFWTSSPYYPKTREEIKAKWQEDRDLGTVMHNNLENYYNYEVCEKECKEFFFFSQFERDYVEKYGWTPFRTEWHTYDLDLRLAGGVDITYFVCLDEKGKSHVVLVDYKRANKISYKGFKGKCGKAPPTSNKDDCNISHYEIQLSLYKYILEMNYDIIVDDMYLLFLHPSQTTYITHRVVWDEVLMNEIILFRKEEISKTHIISCQ